MYRVGSKKIVHITFNHIPHQRALPRCGSFMDPRIIGDIIPAAIPENPSATPFRA